MQTIRILTKQDMLDVLRAKFEGEIQMLAMSRYGANGGIKPAFSFEDLILTIEKECAETRIKIDQLKSKPDNYYELQTRNGIAIDNHRYLCGSGSQFAEIMSFITEEAEKIEEKKSQ